MLNFLPNLSTTRYIIVDMLSQKENKTLKGAGISTLQTSVLLRTAVNIYCVENLLKMYRCIQWPHSSSRSPFVSNLQSHINA